MDATIIIETILIETGLLYSVIDARNIAMLHKLVTKLHELGIIDDKKYDQIMEDFSALANCTGEQFVKKFQTAVKIAEIRDKTHVSFMELQLATKNLIPSLQDDALSILT